MILRRLNAGLRVLDSRRLIVRRVGEIVEVLEVAEVVKILKVSEILEIAKIGEVPPIGPGHFI